MIKRLIAAALTLATVATASLAENKEERQVNGTFTAIEVNKGANVSLIQGDKVALEVVTDGCPTSDVETIVKDGTLTVRMKKRTPGSAVQVLVYFKDIDKVTVRRGASVETDCLFSHKGKLTLDVGAKCEAKMEIEVDELSVDANTSVISLEGKATRQTVFVAGALGESSYDAHLLESEDVSIKALNTDAIVKFSNSLNAESIACTIRYIGDDSKVKKSGTGDVHAY